MPIMKSSPSREVKGAGKKKDRAQILREKALEAAVTAVERLESLLSDPETSNADAIKAATLVFERIYPAQAGEAITGDFEICMREE